VGVTATSALELGIDVGTLDAVALVGYPGTIASTRQQAGRAGRAGRPALAVLIAGSGPLDQYLMRRPESLFDAAPERATLNPENPYILLRHLLCAAWEQPLTEEDVPLLGPDLDEIAGVLAAAGHLERRGERWHSRASDSPAPEVSIRSAGGSPYAIVDASAGGRLLGTADEQTALRTVYPGAIYLHQGESYQVERLDLSQRRAVVQPAAVEFYTVPRVQATVHVETTHDSRPHGGGRASFGEVTVTTRVIGYGRRRLVTETLLETVPLDLPEQSYRTEALWLAVTPVAPETAPPGHDVLGALHALEHALCAIAPLLAMCDREDLGGTHYSDHLDLDGPGVFLYDAHPGGVGVAAVLYEALDPLLDEALELVARCGCADGCPACIHSSRCSSNNTPLDRAGAVRLLEQLVGRRAFRDSHATSRLV
jgi:DEAD/DEAH box helicase domain-containing protein